MKIVMVKDNDGQKSVFYDDDDYIPVVIIKFSFCLSITFFFCCCC